MRIGIVACGKYWEKGCPGINFHVLCFDALQQKHGPLGRLPEVQVVTYKPCCKCSVAGLMSTAQKMLQQEDTEAVVFASCLYLGEKCPAIDEVSLALATEHCCQVVRGSYFSPEETLASLTEHYPADTFTRHLDFFNYRYLISHYPETVGACSPMVSR